LFIIVCGCTVPEPLGEGVALNLELGDALVLVGGDRDELGLGEDKAATLLLLHVGEGGVVPVPPLHQPHPGLELVHGVQDQLTTVVRLIVGDLHLLKPNDLLLQLVSSEGSIRVSVESDRRSRVSLASHQPGAAVVSISVSLVVTGRNVQHHMILDSRLLVNVSEGDPDGGEHSATSPGDDHLRAKLTELVPQILVVEVAGDRGQVLAVALLVDLALLLLLHHCLLSDRVEAGQLVTALI